MKKNTRVVKQLAVGINDQINVIGNMDIKNMVALTFHTSKIHLKFKILIH